MAGLSGPRRLTIALSGTYVIALIVTYFVVYMTTMDRLVDERGPGVVLVEGAFRAVWEEAAYEARWAAIGSVALIIAITVVIGTITLVTHWVLRGYRQH